MCRKIEEMLNSTLPHTISKEVEEESIAHPARLLAGESAGGM